MFAYCNNNPVLLSDYAGCKSYSTDLADCAVFAVEGYEVYTYYYYDSCELPDYDGMQFSYKPNKRGRVYIASGPNIPSYPSNFRNGDVLVWDNRGHEEKKGNDSWHDPNMRICDSYSYLNHGQQNAIAEVICNYALHHPSEYEWLHTADTVVKEWQGHNMWYYWLRPFGKLGLFADAIKSARHVDLDNDDVGKGFWGLLG